MVGADILKGWCCVGEEGIDEGRRDDLGRRDVTT